MEVNPVGKLLSEVDRAYLSGFLDGDGAIMALIERHPEKRFGFRVRVELKITQFHESDVVWLLELTGIGRVCKNLNTYEWVVRDQRAIAALLDQLQSYVRVKREQIALALQILRHPMESRNHLIEMARLADALSKFNVRSKRRRRNHAAMIEESMLP